MLTVRSGQRMRAGSIQSSRQDQFAPTKAEPDEDGRWPRGARPAVATELIVAESRGAGRMAFRRLEFEDGHLGVLWRENRSKAA
jgi:hypothetical protein